MPGLGTAVNIACVVAGTLAGLLAGARLPARVRTTMLHGVGLVIFALGVSQATRTRNTVFPLVALVLGGAVGELLGLEDRLERLGERLRRMGGGDPEVEGATSPSAPAAGARPPRPPFTEGFVTASLIYCVGPLAILGSIQDGLSRDISLLVVKAALDGLVSVILAATLGWGVGASAVSILVYQGALTALAGSANDVLTDRMVTEMTATGGVMVMGIAVRLLEVKHVRVGSLLPALLIVPVLVALFAT